MIVDVHAHLYPRPFMELLAAEGPRRGVSLTADAPPVLCFEGIRFWRYTPAFHDVDARLRALDDAGVDRQVLSLGPPMVYWADADLGLRLARVFNDEIAAVARAHPDRFVAFAAVPLQDVPGALAELDRALDRGFAGVAIGSNVDGMQVDDARLGPFWERVNALGVPVFVHPINPAGHGDLHEYRLDLSVGFPFETTIAAARLVLSGLLARLPRLRVCLAHLGGALPVLRERLVLGWEVGREHFGARYGLDERPEASVERFWFDVIAYHEPALLAGVACVGADRLVIGSDAPFAVGDLARSVASVRDFSFLPRRDRDRILHTNALEYLTGARGAARLASGDRRGAPGPRLVTGRHGGIAARLRSADKAATLGAREAGARARRAARKGSPWAGSSTSPSRWTRRRSARRRPTCGSR